MFLGIDTSCYTTSCAVVDEAFRVVSSSRKLLPVELGKRGLRQSEAVFAHVRQMPEVLKEALAGIDTAELQAVCATDRPVNDADSYMPVFMAGSGLAASLAATLRVPCYATSHQEGHLMAAQIGCDPLPPIYLAFHLSGGTTDLLLVTPGRGAQRVGGSLDLHAGQLMDRVGVAMGLAFPAGPHMEALAAGGKAVGRYPASTRGMDMHLSGAEAQCMRDVETGHLAHACLAAELYDFLSRSILRVLGAACEAYQCPDVLLFGGVASSLLLRERMQERVRARRLGLELRFGQPQYSGDNAAGVAIVGARKYTQQQEEEHHG